MIALQACLKVEELPAGPAGIHFWVSGDFFRSAVTGGESSSLEMAPELSEEWWQLPVAPWKADPWLAALGAPCQGQTFHGEPGDRGHPARASNLASTTWVWRGTEGEEELVKIPAFPEAQCCLISGKCPRGTQGRWVGVGPFGSPPRESGGTSPPTGLAENWNDGKCLGKEVEFGGL